MLMDALIDDFANTTQIHKYMSYLLNNEREELLKTGYFDKQLQHNPALIIHQDSTTYNQEQNNVINYLFKNKKKYKQMPMRQQCVLDEIVKEVNKINPQPNHNIGKQDIFVISDVEGDVYSLLRFLKHIGALQSISIVFDKNGNPQLIPSWNDNFNAKIVFDGDHTSCRSFFNKECVDVLLSLQDKFSKNKICLIKGNHEYDIYYDGAEKGSVLYDAKKRIYDKCIDKAVIQSGKNIYHFMHSANFALASSKIILPKKFNTEFDDIVDFPRTYKMSDMKIITDMYEFQCFLNKIGFKNPQNHHIVFGHDIDWDKTISKRLKKYGLLPVDNDNKNYFRISNDNIVEYDNGTGIQLENYTIAKPLLINNIEQNNYKKYMRYYNMPTKRYKNKIFANLTNKHLYNNAMQTQRLKNKYNSTMKNIFLKTISSNRNLNGYYLLNKPKYF